MAEIMFLAATVGVAEKVFPKGPRAHMQQWEELGITCVAKDTFTACKSVAGRLVAAGCVVTVEALDEKQRSHFLPARDSSRRALRCRKHFHLLWTMMKRGLGILGCACQCPLVFC
jgi:hypothetical protein